MNKSILMLINGFGIEKKDSVEIYSKTLMPNLDNMMNSYVFGPLNAPAGDYNNGYRLFSIAQNNEKENDPIDEMIFDKTLEKNSVLLQIASSLNEQNKLHIYYVVDRRANLSHLKEFLKIINPNKDKKVFVDLILTGGNIEDYKEIIKTISRVSFEFAEYCQLGFVVGKNRFNSEETIKTILREFGEHWNEPTKKVEILKKDVVNPEDVTPFHVNNGFTLSANDIVLFLNYENLPIDKVYQTLSSMKVICYSLYELIDGITNMFVKPKSSYTSFATLLENHGIKILVLTDQSRINDINFYLNGMQKRTSTNIIFAVNDISLFSSKESVIKLVESSEYDGIIIDYHIGLLNKVKDIKDELSRIDSTIKPLSEAALEKGYTFIISSLYGVHVQVMDGVVPKVLNYSLRVPCIFQNNEFIKGDYAINTTDTYGLALTFLTSIKDEVRSNKLLHKRSKLEKLLSRK